MQQASAFFFIIWPLVHTHKTAALQHPRADGSRKNGANCCCGHCFLVHYAPFVIPPPLQSIPRTFSLQVPSVRVDFSWHSDTNVCHRHSCLAPPSQHGWPAVGNCHWSLTLPFDSDSESDDNSDGDAWSVPTSSDCNSQLENGDDETEVEVVWAKAARGVWGQGHVFDGKLYLTRDICKHDQIPEQLRVPVKSNPTKPASKRAGNRAAQLTLSSNSPLSMSRSSRLFGVVKRSFTQCLWKGHAHRSNIMFQCGSHYPCCACTAAVLKCCGSVMQSPPPPGGGEPSRHCRGDYKGGVRYLMAPNMYQHFWLAPQPCLQTGGATDDTCPTIALQVRAVRSFVSFPFWDPQQYVKN